MKKAIIAISTACTLLLSSCAVGPNFSTLNTDVADDYQFDTTVQADSVSMVQWWELFNSPQIDTLVYHALENNKDLDMAISRLDQAAAMHGISRANMVPAVSFGVGASRGKQTNEMPVGNSFSVAPQVDWEIDVWGKMRRTKESSEAALIATNYGVRAVQIQLISSVIETYINLVREETKLQIAEQTLESRQKNLGIMEARFASGSIPQIDLHHAQIEVKVAKSAISGANLAITNERNRLAVLLGEMPDTELISVSLSEGADLLPPHIPMAINSTLLKRRPDLMQSLYQVKSQNAQVGVAVAQRFPSLSLTGMLGLASSDLSNFVSGGPAWNVGAGLVGPLFNLNGTKRRVEMEKAKTEEVLTQYEKNVITAFAEVENSLASIQSFREQYDNTSKKLEFAQNAGDLSNVRYNKGFSNYLEVLESERTLFSVGMEKAEIHAAYLISYVKLYASLGGGWSTPEEETVEMQKIADRNGTVISDRELRKEIMAEAKTRR